MVILVTSNTFSRKNYTKALLHYMPNMNDLKLLLNPVMVIHHHILNVIIVSNMTTHSDKNPKAVSSNALTS